MSLTSTSPPAPASSATIRENVAKLHTAINDGSLDRTTADESLKALTALADELDGTRKKVDDDKADDKSGAKPAAGKAGAHG